MCREKSAGGIETQIDCSVHLFLCPNFCCRTLGLKPLKFEEWFLHFNGICFQTHLSTTFGNTPLWYLFPWAMTPLSQQVIPTLAILQSTFLTNSFILKIFPLRYSLFDINSQTQWWEVTLPALLPWPNRTTLLTPPTPTLKSSIKSLPASWSMCFSPTPPSTLRRMLSMKSLCPLCHSRTWQIS